VVSFLLPKRLHQDFYNVYAFCRWADDLGDEIGDKQESLRLLDWWREQLDAMYAGETSHPVFVALRGAVDRHGIPREPFADLIRAFIQDQTVARYPTYEDLFEYCRYSANPVGRLVLRLCGYSDPERVGLSDATCTALQLVNFWQDVRRDILERDRVYIPRVIAAELDLEIEALVAAVRADAATDRHSGSVAAELLFLRDRVQATVAELCRLTAPLFERGRQLWPLLSADVRPAIQLFTLGGESILRRIEGIQHDTAVVRPSLSRFDRLWLAMRAAWVRVTTWS
jgi:squalene synthase HpnC